MHVPDCNSLLFLNKPVFVGKITAYFIFKVTQSNLAQSHVVRWWQNHNTSSEYKVQTHITSFLSLSNFHPSLHFSLLILSLSVHLCFFLSFSVTSCTCRHVPLCLSLTWHQPLWVSFCSSLIPCLSIFHFFPSFILSISLLKHLFIYFPFRYPSNILVFISPFICMGTQGFCIFICFSESVVYFLFFSESLPVSAYLSSSLFSPTLTPSFLSPFKVSDFPDILIISSLFTLFKDRKCVPMCSSYIPC